MFNTRSLRRAIKAGDIKEITEILHSAPKDGIRLYMGWTPLHIAAKGGNKDAVAAILDTGADINATTEMHQTPLDIALQCDHKTIIKLLQKKGARAGALLALHPAIAAGNLKAIRKHVAAGADINQLVNGELPIGLALARRQWAAANYLLNKKCDITKSQQWQKKPLHIAAAAGAPLPLLAKILKLGANIDDTDACYQTPLCYAAEAGNTEIVNWLIDHGADVTRGREHGSTPVYCALNGGHAELASCLIDQGGKATLHQAIQCNHLVRARQKLNGGADVNHEEDPHHSETPLEMAIWLDSTDMVTLLLEFGADPNQQARSYQNDHGMGGGNTALHEAVYKGSAKMVKLLLAHGADPDIGNASGLSPIELARRKNHLHLANLMETHIDKKLSLEAGKSEIEPLYTVSKVAELLSVDDTFILELIKSGKITGLKLDEKTLRISGLEGGGGDQRSECGQQFHAIISVHPGQQPRSTEDCHDDAGVDVRQ